jgi:hypothetical protein
MDSHCIRLVDDFCLPPLIQYCIVSELIPGRTLRMVLRVNATRLHEGPIRRLGHSLLEAIACALLQPE